MENINYQLEKRVSKKSGKTYYCFTLYFEYKGEQKERIYPVFENDLLISELIRENAKEVK